LESMNKVEDKELGQMMKKKSNIFFK